MQCNVGRFTRGSKEDPHCFLSSFILSGLLIHDKLNEFNYHLNEFDMAEISSSSKKLKWRIVETIKTGLKSKVGSCSLYYLPVLVVSTIYHSPKDASHSFYYLPF